MVISYNSFASPAVLQLVKVNLLYLPCKIRASQPDIIHLTMETLNKLLSRNSETLRSRPHTPKLNLDGESNMDTLGLPIHMDPFISSQALDTDARLLHALGVFVDKEGCVKFNPWSSELQL